MTNVGALATNFHEGSRSEYLAQYVFASYGTAIPVPHQEDSGVDFYCTITEQVGKLAWPRYHYTVQVKSTMSPWDLGTPESVQWLVKHPLPLLLCVVDKSSQILRLYHTFPRFLIWTHGLLPDSLQLSPQEKGAGECTQWEGGSSFSLGPPILEWSLRDLLDDAFSAKAKSVIEFWLRAEEANLAYITMGVPMFAMPATYTTNETENKGWAWQGGATPEGMDRVRETLGKILPWYTDEFRREKDLQGMVRAALLLRYLFPNYEGPSTPHAPFVDGVLTNALAPNGYVHEGIDLIGKNLDQFLEKVTPVW